ncbi:MAG: hypothetical protein ACSHYB_01165 [Roseibacillus sp.]
MPEEIYLHRKTILGSMPRIVTLLVILLIGCGKFTFGEASLNFAPWLAALMFMVQFKWLIWEWRPQRWSLTLGPKALIFEAQGKCTSIPKTDITRILASQTKRKTREYILLQTDGSYHVIPSTCIGNNYKFEETMTTLGYPLEAVEA